MVGLILVDSTNSHLDLMAMLPPETPEENQDIPQLRHVLTQETQEITKPEEVDPIESAAQARTITSFGALPLKVLTHASDPWIDMLVTAFPGFPRMLATKLAIHPILALLNIAMSIPESSQCMKNRCKRRPEASKSRSQE